MSAENDRRGSARGRYIVVAGPDGTGKTTIADYLRGAALNGSTVLHLHHRPRVLGGLTSHEGPVTEPHKDPPYLWVVSVAKVLYLYADYLLGWLLRLRPHLRAGGDVLLERGWWDLLVDPARYRLRPHTRLLRMLGRLLPSPTSTIVLLADSEILALRTEELTAAELDRQVRAWRELTDGVRIFEVDASATLAVVQDAVVQVLQPKGVHGWIALPRRDSPRWILPRRPRAATVNGLRVYSPVTPKGVVAWWLARFMAKCGASTLLPAAAPPLPTLDAVADLLPAGGTVAVGHGSHEARRVAMVLDADGVPFALVKLADDGPGEAALMEEAASMRQLRAHLPKALRIPRILSEAPGRLVLEPLPWMLRILPWRLPAPVARGLGELYGSGATDGLGPAHGDCAPWNLLRTPDGWHLVDWSDATAAAPPFTDLWHYVTQSHALLGRPSRRAIFEGLGGRGHVGAALLAYCRGADLDPMLARTAFVDYLQRTWPTLDPATADGRRGRSARSLLLAALGQENPDV